jgi:hypothetical protein
MSEVSLDGICPRARLGTWRSFLSQNGEYGSGGLTKRARSEQPKAPNSVVIGFRDLLSSVQECF